MPPPNIMVIVLDTARRDAVAPYAEATGVTPAIADLARRGRAVAHAYATASWTLPSHASLFTGVLSRGLGLGQHPAGGHGVTRATLEGQRDRLLPAVLQAAGYATVGFSTNAWVSPVNGFDLGFDSFRYVNSGRDERMNALVGEGWRSQLAWAREGLSARADDGAAEVGRGLRESIRAWSGTPTFWFVNLVECHSPYLPPRPWNDLGPRERLRAALDNQRHLNFEAICLYIAGHHDVPPEAMARLRHLYSRGIASMDHWMSGILEGLDERGILDETLVIVTSDHGENFGEGGLIAHGFSVDERLVHVPLVLAGPGADRAADLFSLAELPQLLGEAAELRSAPWRADDLPAGAAVAQYDSIGSLDDPAVEERRRGHGIDRAGMARLCRSFTAATDGRHKLVVADGGEELYDLAADPHEERPLDPATVDGAAAAVAGLRAALEHPAVTRSSAPADPPAGARSPTAQEMAEIERKMKLLGYM